LSISYLYYLFYSYYLNTKIKKAWSTLFSTSPTWSESFCGLFS